MDYFLLSMVVLCFTANQIAFKAFTRGVMKTGSSYFLFTFFHMSLALAIFVVSGIDLGHVHPQTLVIGIVFGIFQLGVLLGLTKALAEGPASYTSLFFATGLLIPLVLGLVFWEEKMLAVQAAGIVLLFVSLFIGGKNGGSAGKKANPRWLLWCFIAFLCNGVNMSLAKLQARLVLGKEVNEFLAIAFMVSVPLALLVFLFSREKGAAQFTVGRIPLLLALVAVVGVSNAAANQWAVSILSRLPTVIVFPVMNGGSVFLTSLASVVLFKEKLNVLGVVGLLVGIAALAMVCMR